ncbi:uncharacterized protein FOMMEDRAFT_165198 [Fomitiporia mediterranea MF3/22]|uniref:uncharacterized protein n=1 Tax=Fomitiporia mediterranea (strain MF3/22) TaxID=694068 RepID=UPI0004408620|nr:uncharacterized protein FOMMEDRAFT_165198 [Fomitiporia mediterranea MF3/22]EJD06370.1 hypothetical protein FOMMEDRAFT_165198 [Fomitiporia mediterranea MF3/22]
MPTFSSLESPNSKRSNEKASEMKSRPECFGDDRNDCRIDLTRSGYVPDNLAVCPHSSYGDTFYGHSTAQCYVIQAKIGELVSVYTYFRESNSTLRTQGGDDARNTVNPSTSGSYQLRHDRQSFSRSLTPGSTSRDCAPFTESSLVSRTFSRVHFRSNYGRGLLNWYNCERIRVAMNHSGS